MGLCKCQGNRIPIDRTLSRQPSFRPACLCLAAMPPLAVVSRSRIDMSWAAWPVRMRLSSSRKTQDPVQGILDTPVAAHGLQQVPGIGWQAGDGVAGLRGDLRTCRRWDSIRTRLCRLGQTPSESTDRMDSDVLSTRQRRVSTRPWFLFTVLWKSWSQPSKAFAYSTAKVSTTASCSCSWLPLNASTQSAQSASGNPWRRWARCRPRAPASRVVPEWPCSRWTGRPLDMGPEPDALRPPRRSPGAGAARPGGHTTEPNPTFQNTVPNLDARHSEPCCTRRLLQSAPRSVPNWRTNVEGTRPVHGGYRLAAPLLS